CKAGSEQRGEGDQQHQSFNASEDVAFVLLYLANLLGMRVRNNFLNLICNRLRVRRAVPAVAVGRIEGVRIAAGESVFGLGPRTDKNFANCTGLAGNRLGYAQW